MTIPIITTIILAIALAMDCFAVSITVGVKERKFYIVKCIKISLAFGIFQAVMPLIGWLCTNVIHHHIETLGHFIAFGLLVFIGVKMIIEAIKEGSDDNEKGKDSFDVDKWSVLIWLAIATSIDALAVGVSYGAMGIDILIPSVIIGVFSACFAIVGLIVGIFLGDIFGNKAELAGGVVLILLGLKTLIENLIDIQ